VLAPRGYNIGLREKKKRVGSPPRQRYLAKKIIYERVENRAEAVSR